jgi:hypothetical protein
MRPIREASTRVRRRLGTVAAIAAAAALVPAAAGADHHRPQKIDRALAAQDVLAQRLYPGGRQPATKPVPNEVVAQRVAAPNTSEAVVEWLSRWGPVDSREIP